MNTRDRESRDKDEDIEQALEKKSFFSDMSKAEKLFWGTIVVFFIVFGIISIIAISRSQDIVTQTQKKPVTKEFIEKLFPSGIVKDNIIKNEKEINQNLNLELQQMYSSVDREIDNLFYPVEQNIDKFLDFHYSVIGEYTELGTMAFGDINKMIEEKLFGKDFANRINQSSNYMQEQYRTRINSHLSTVDKYATEGVDKNINNEVLTNLQESIKNNNIRLSVQAAAPVGVMLGVKLAAVISSKIAAKATAKGVAKASSKVAAKTAAAGTGAALGTMCGPFFWICSPVAAGTLWVATDIVVVSGDEYFTRDELKKEILQSLNESKIRLKNSYKEVYYKSFQEFSKNVRNEYNNTAIQEKRLIKVKDKF
ncbi:MAG: hypothetical protein GQ570_05615 [Helicobacteraceae bacterium]|nr:hypothetical protein [Helicobacteraceae bacterium]